MGAQVRGVAPLTGLVAVKLSIASYMVGGLKAGCDCRVSYPQAATALLCYIQCHATSWNSSDWGLLPRVPLGAPLINLMISMGQTMVGWTIPWWEAQVSKDEVVR